MTGNWNCVAKSVPSILAILKVEDPALEKFSSADVVVEGEVGMVPVDVSCGAGEDFITFGPSVTDSLTAADVGVSSKISVASFKDCSAAALGSFGLDDAMLASVTGNRNCETDSVFFNFGVRKVEDMVVVDLMF